MDFKKGDHVLVKVSGMKVPVSGTITSTKKNDAYMVKLSSGEEKSVNKNKITLNEIREPSQRTGRSPSRKAGSPSRNKSATRELRSPRTRSPARRSPGRPSRKSPSRRSPTRASPSRKVKSQNLEFSPSPKRKALTQAGITKFITIPVEKLHIEPNKPVEVTSPPIIAQLRSRKPIENITETMMYKKVTSEVINNFNTSSSSILENLKLREPEKIIHMVRSSVDREEEDKYSDDEIDFKNQIFIKEKSLPRTIQQHYEFGGSIGAFFCILLFPLIVVALQVFCNKKSCNYTEMPALEQFKKLDTFLNLEVFGVYTVYLLLVAIISKIPIGGCRVVNQPSRYKMMDYYLNGKFIMLVLFTILGVLEWKEYKIFKFISDRYLQFSVAAMIYSLVISVITYIHSSYVPVSALNLHTVSSSFIYKFFMGREVNPRFFNFDVKMFLIYSGIIGVVIVQAAYMYNSILLDTQGTPLTLDNVHIDPTLLTAAFFYMFYAINIIYYERNLITTFDLQSEGVGFAYALGLLVYPFVHTSITKYIYEHGVQLQLWQLGIMSFVLFTSYIFMQESNNQKNLFRINPFHPKVAHLETIPTALGKKLLVSGYWGIVRHPNYLADLIFHLTYAMFAALVPASLPMYISVLVLIHRVGRDGKRCQQRYGPSWDRYCQRVRYALIPKIY